MLPGGRHPVGGGGGGGLKHGGSYGRAGGDVAGAGQGGGRAGGPQRSARRRYANDLGSEISVIAVSARSNRQKSDQDPST
ncbi:hypothetical protein Slala03_71960 [Streptomyces lavendulae subsp. lavendulae]|nr:hypothetical protein Slala03_71960 [Streptomyces lavendulae subsp. lavendulae]